MSLNKLRKVNESFAINMYDNGYMVDVTGRSEDDDWIGAKIVCATIEEVVALIKEIDSKPKVD